MNWNQKNKGRWECDGHAVQLVGYGDNLRFSAYRGGKYIGSRRTLELAQELSETGPVPVLTGTAPTDLVPDEGFVPGDTEMAKRKAKENGSVIDAAAYDYEKMRVRDPKSGRIRHSASNGDAIAGALLKFKTEGGKFSQVAKDNEFPMKEADYKNPGQFRMALGSRLRAVVRAGTPVKIGTVTVKTLDQEVKVPVELAAGEVDKAKKARKRKAA